MQCYKRDTQRVLFASTAEAQADAAILAGTLDKRKRDKYVKSMIRKQTDALEERLS
eukprot:SAG11_NODE_8396_length_1021_cov_0.965293_2_plen_56_part_00